MHVTSKDEREIATMLFSNNIEDMSKQTDRYTPARVMLFSTQDFFMHSFIHASCFMLHVSCFNILGRFHFFASHSIRNPTETIQPRHPAWLCHEAKTESRRPRNTAFSCMTQPQTPWSRRKTSQRYIHKCPHKPVTSLLNFIQVHSHNVARSPLLGTCTTHHRRSSQGQRGRIICG